jgi:LmbE family N-acetylglucosaminyl deacetylase
MFPLILAPKPGQPIQILCLGAHADDIEIGCGGTVLKWLAAYPDLEVYWVVFSANAERSCEAQRSVSLFLKTATQKTVLIRNFRDGFFPYSGTEIKEYFEELKQEIVPDLIFTHYREDRHQDHRIISDLTWNTYRNHLILEYEIPKYDGDLGLPNCYVSLDGSICREKIQFLRSAFSSQKEKPWFDEEVFLGLMRLRGVEAGGLSQYAEAFYTRKIVLGS